MAESKEVILSKEYLEKLEDELEYLKTKRRPEIAEKIKIIAAVLIYLFFICCFTIEGMFFWEIMPILEAISCNTIVAKIESTITHSKEYPNLAPANVHTVTVPGPINAAATSVPGPMFFK